MRFALLGNHRDGLAVARALSQTGRHEIAAVTTPLSDDDRQAWPNAKPMRDLEDLLADPALEAIIVAGSLLNRPVQLRRALQSERHVLCVHPADLNPDIAYEAAMIQQDTGMVLLPLLPAGLHPGLVKLQEWLRSSAGPVKLIELEWTARTAILVMVDGPGAKGRAAVPGWELLRRLGGDVAEVTAFSERPELSIDAPLFVSGTFQRGGQFQLTLRPQQPEPRGRLTVSTEKGRAEMIWTGDTYETAQLSWQSEDDRGEGSWNDPRLWVRLVEVFEQYLARDVKERAAPGAPLTWQDEVRCLELDDAVVRSVEKRRAMTLEYPEATEEAGFKGTMTLVGCSVLWIIVLLVILSIWVPWLGWFIIPVLGLFLLMQLFLWVARRPSKKSS